MDHARCSGQVTGGPRAFTLIELLVVISILALLISLLLPALGSAKRHAQSVNCLTQMRQQGVGWSSYISDFRQIPGLHYNEGTYGGRPWGTLYMYGGINLYVADLALGGNTGQYVGVQNLGFIVPYVVSGATWGNATRWNSLDGRIFYCPGTSVSFGPRAGGSLPWYEYWKANMGQPLAQGSGDSVVSTYFHRSGLYEKNKGLPDTDPAWGSVANWTRDIVSRPDSPWIANKPMLTCYWPGFVSNPPTYGPPNEANATHGGRSTNLLRTDGSAYSWALPSDVKPVWGWFDAGAYSAITYSADYFHKQTPWFWVRANRKQ